MGKSVDDDHHLALQQVPEFLASVSMGGVLIVGGELPAHYLYLMLRPPSAQPLVGNVRVRDGDPGALVSSQNRISLENLNWAVVGPRAAVCGWRAIGKEVRNWYLQNLTKCEKRDDREGRTATLYLGEEARRQPTPTAKVPKRETSLHPDLAQPLPNAFHVPIIGWGPLVVKCHYTGV